VVLYAEFTTFSSALAAKIEKLEKIKLNKLFDKNVPLLR
jgi:hypothetical protein